MHVSAFVCGGALEQMWLARYIMLKRAEAAVNSSSGFAQHSLKPYILCVMKGNWTREQTIWGLANDLVVSEYENNYDIFFE